MYLQTNSKKESTIPVVLHGILLLVLLHRPPTVSSFRSWGSPSRPLFPVPKVVENVREERTAAVGKKSVDDPFWTNLLPFSGTAMEDDGVLGNTKRVMREMGIEYDPTTSPKLGVVGLDQIWDVLYAALLFVFRRGSGTFAWGYAVSVAPENTSLYTPLAIGRFQLLESSSLPPTPQPPSSSTTRTARTKIQIYDDSPSSSQSRPVHETISRLGLEVEHRPCPIGGGTRRMVKDRFGDGTTFPLLIDGENGVELFDADDIIDYLLRFWGGSSTGGKSALSTPALPQQLSLGRNTATRRMPSNPPPQPLVLYSFEGCPFSMAVQEELYRLEIGFRYVSCPRGGANRQRLFELTRVQQEDEEDGEEGDGGGRFQVPYLEDPNTGVGLFESGVIVEYLRGRYGVAESPVQYM